MRSIAWRHFQWPWRTSYPVFKVTAFLKSNIWNTVRFTDRVSIENHTQSIEWCHFQWPWVTSDPDQGHDIFWSRISEKRCVLKTNLLLHKEKIPNIWNGIMFGDLDWPLNASRWFVSISWASCFIPSADTQFPGNPFIGMQNTRGVWKFFDFWLKSPSFSEIVRDRPMVAMKRWRPG